MKNFEFQIALLGGSGVGKTSLIHKIINNYMNSDDDGHQQVAVSISQDMIKHRLITSNNESMKVMFFDTKGHNVKSSLKQFYRNKQAFVVMCDLTDEDSILSVTSWIEEIGQQANIRDNVIIVLANKYDELENEN